MDMFTNPGQDGQELSDNTFSFNNQDWNYADPTYQSMWGDNMYGVSGGNNMLGFSGSAYDNFSPENDSPTMSNEYRNWMDQQYGKGWFQGTQVDQNSGIATGGLFNQGGEMQASRQWMMPSNSGDLAAIVSTLSPMITGGVQGMNPGSAFFDNPLTQRIFNNALTNAGLSLAQGGDPLKGAVQGGVNAAIPGVNVAGQVGIENPNLANIFNRGLQGASSAAINGGNVFASAAQAAAPSALGAIKDLFAGDMPDVGTLGGTTPDSYGETSTTLGGARTPDQQAANYQALNTGQVPSSMSSSLQQSSTAPQVSSVPGVAPSRAPGWAQGLSGVFGLYSAYDNQRRARNMMKSLGGLFGANSPYAKQLRQKLEREDARRGRRSDYAGRETQLAAALADRQAQTMPTMANLQAMQSAGLNGMFNNALKLGTNTDVTNWLGSIFKGG